MIFLFHKAKDKSTSDTLIVQVSDKEAYIFNKTWLPKENNKPTKSSLDYVTTRNRKEWSVISREEALKFLITVGACMP